MTKSLPVNPNLEHLRNEAKSILKAHKKGDPSCCAMFRHLHQFKGKSDEDILNAKVSLQEVQFVLTMEYGFESWAKLKKHVESKQEHRDVDIHAKLAEEGNKAADEIAEAVIKNPACLSELLNEVHSGKKKVKNGAAKALRTISDTHPGLLYGKCDEFAEFLGQKDTILKWIVMDIIGNLSSMDVENRIGKPILKKFYTFLSDESMVTAAHSVENLGKIAANKNQYGKEITNQLLRVETIERNDECRNILLGKVIMAFSRYFDQASKKEKQNAISLSKRQLSNSRNATRKKAEKFLKDRK